ncbi:Fe-only nitrogenase accessory protein AnfO [Pseudobacteroides cellulosolvens]|uniref:Fe-only nitrogenase accessory protein AnfO n=1 Tax=Pseudobacteroides cellulosolvens ATCC 35603 = DSM 2933 TaxID=398512 RepID=A0A0L6JSW2_9FIRM|nr:Fe-only nitrogenase accessory protein AnfO [Pseudobacteroides cellulosolvens]KNY28779.1 Fe-only nitrogenase accessory protein AnfO [Pseudobacteroides cellulosolvens ATCC 35603 = DSM 2933]
MSLKIAVFLNEENKTTSVFNPSIVKVFQKKEEKWITDKQFCIFLDMKKGISAFREQLVTFINLIKDVKVVVAREISGIPYNIMDKEGFDICENNEFSESLLESILEAKNTDIACCCIDNTEDIDTAPVENKISGNYFFDLQKLLAKKTSLTSKQALLPFLKTTTFHELEVICSHVPPWFEVEFKKLNLNHEVIKLSENKYKVIIAKKTCNE